MIAGKFKDSNKLKLNGFNNSIVIDTVSRTTNYLFFEAYIKINADANLCIYSEGNSPTEKSIFIGVAGTTTKVIVLTDTLGVDHLYDITNALLPLYSEEGKLTIIYENGTLMVNLNDIRIYTFPSINIELKKGTDYEIKIGYSNFSAAGFHLDGFLYSVFVNTGENNYELPLQEGDGNIIVEKVNSYILTLSGTIDINTWGSKQSNTFNNLNSGFDLWENNTSGQLAYISFNNNNESILTDVGVYSGYTWKSRNPYIRSGINNSENICDFTNNGLNSLCDPLLNSWKYGVITGLEGKEHFFVPVKNSNDDVIGTKNHAIFSAEITGTCFNSTVSATGLLPYTVKDSNGQIVTDINGEYLLSTDWYI